MATLQSPAPASGLIGRESQSTAPHSGQLGSVTRAVHLKYTLADGAAVQVSTVWDSGADAPVAPLLQELLTNREYERAGQPLDTSAGLIAGKPAGTVPVEVDGHQVSFVDLRGTGGTLVALGCRDGERRIAIVVPATHRYGIGLLSQPR